MKIAAVGTRLVFALIFLLGAIVPSVVALAAPQAASRVFRTDCHLQTAAVQATTADAYRNDAAAGGTGHDHHKVYGACVCVLCLTPVPPGSFGDAETILLPAARAVARLSFATGVSATFGPRKATNFATGPPMSPVGPGQSPA